MIALLVITDGRRDCLTATLASAATNLHGPITRRLMVNDSGDVDHQQWLDATYGDASPWSFEILHHARRSGFAAAIRTAWAQLEGGDEPYVFHLEDDFTFNRAVPLVDMALVLDLNPQLLQLALRRQPWNEAERVSGGIVEQHPDAYVEMVDHAHRRWLEHRLFFTTNPSLYRRDVCLQRWPEGRQSEGRFTHRLLADPDVRFGFWGDRDSGEWVTHIGAQRVGAGY